MANTNSPFGFRQISGIGSAPTYEQVTIGPGGVSGGIAFNAAAIYYGDPVARADGGASTLVQAAGSATTSTVTMAGIFQGCKYLSTAIGRTVWSNFWPGGSPVTSANSGSIEAYIINDPNAKFVAQTDSTGFAAADIGSNVDFAIGTGNASSGISGASLTHGGATSSAYPFRFYDLVWAPPGANGVSIAATAAAFNYAIVGFVNVETRNLTAPNT